MRKVKVKKGKHDFKPGSGLSFWTGDHSISTKYIDSGGSLELFSIKCEFQEDCWFDPSPEGPIQRDGKDINKLGGLSCGNLFSPKTWPKNRNSILVGFRPAEVKGLIELHGYVNFEDGSHNSIFLGAVDTGENVVVTASLMKQKGRDLEASFHTSTKSYVGVENIPFSIVDQGGFFDFTVTVDPWFGGNRKSPQEMSLFVKQENLL